LSLHKPASWIWEALIPRNKTEREGMDQNGLGGLAILLVWYIEAKLYPRFCSGVGYFYWLGSKKKKKKLEKYIKH
jgi:hypothetical protein